MSAITIVGGVYHECCIWPSWDQVFGSAGRAAAALSGHVDQITLRTYAREDTAAHFAPYASVYNFTFEPITVEQTISFDYIHSLSEPVVRPALNRIRPNPAIEVEAELVLRFGMLEGSAIVRADRCVYDPQAPFGPESFEANGSQAAHLAVVANRREVLAMSGAEDPIQGGQKLLAQGVEVVVVKSGAEGAFVIDASGVNKITAYCSNRVWTIGSGDVFSAMFAARWGVYGDTPVEAAELASRSVAAYADLMALPLPTVSQLRNSPRQPSVAQPGRAYLASPFFTLGQRWLVDEARRGLLELGLSVFSPVHDVGRGPAEEVAPADLSALDQCNLVFALLDGLDSGTLFEVGYARARGLPVYALAQAVPLEELAMVVGSGCRVFDDFVTALHHASWRT